MIEMIKLTLKPIGVTLLGLSILIMCGVIGSDTAWAYVSSMEYLPLGIGNSWDYKVVGGSDLQAVVDRLEKVNGVDTFVVRDSVNSTVIGENYWTSDNGIHLHKTFMVNGVEINGAKKDLTVTFDPAVVITNPIINLNETVVTTGNLKAEFGQQGEAGTINTTYTSSFKVEQVGTTAVSQAGIFLGGRITGTIEIPGPPPLGGVNSFDSFFGNNVGLVQGTFDLLGHPRIEKELKDTNLINVNTNVVVASLPDIRAKTTDNLISGVATGINAGNNECVDGRVGIDRDSWKLGKLGIDFFFAYFKADQQNQITDGTINPTVNVPAGGQQQYVWFINARSEFTEDFQIAFACKNSFRSAFNSANNLRLTYKHTLMLDIPMFGKAVNNDGYMDIPTNGIGIAAASSINLGNKSGPVTVAFNPAGMTPFWGRICMTDQNGACFGVPTESVEVSYGIGETHSFGLFGIYMGDIADDPAKNRGEVVATDADGNKVGGTDFAIRTIPPIFF